MPQYFHRRLNRSIEPLHSANVKQHPTEPVHQTTARQIDTDTCQSLWSDADDEMSDDEAPDTAANHVHLSSEPSHEMTTSNETEEEHSDKSSLSLHTWRCHPTKSHYCDFCHKSYYESREEHGRTPAHMFRMIHTLGIKHLPLKFSANSKARKESYSATTLAELDSMAVALYRIPSCGGKVQGGWSDYHQRISEMWNESKTLGRRLQFVVDEMRETKALEQEHAEAKRSALRACYEYRHDNEVVDFRTLKTLRKKDSRKLAGAAADRAALHESRAIFAENRMADRRDRYVADESARAAGTMHILESSFRDATSQIPKKRRSA